LLPFWSLLLLFDFI